MGVVVPARDEAETIAATIASIRDALDHVTDLVVSSVVVVVADRCEDDTADRAAAALGDAGTVLVRSHGMVGAARAAGSEWAVRSLRASPSEGRPTRIWLANTDADSVVPTGWIRRQLTHAAAGVACVTGVVELPPTAPVLRAGFERTYRPGVGTHTHRHVHGANLGVDAGALARIGNWSSLATGEDHDLWQRVGAAGLQRRQDPDLVVTTSARTTGRAPAGFAVDLAELVGTDPRH